MAEKILIVEDEFIVAHDLQMMLQKAGYEVLGIAASVSQALAILKVAKPDLVLLDIYLKGKMTGIDLAHQLLLLHIPFIYISANSNEKVLEAAKATEPYGFIVKPYRESDVLLSIDIARYRYQHSINFRLSTELYMQGLIEDLAKLPLSLDQKLVEIASAFQPYLPFDFITILIITSKGRVTYESAVSRKKFNEYEVCSLPAFMGLANIPESAYQQLEQLVPDLSRDAVYVGNDFTALCEKSSVKNLIASNFGMQSNLVKAFNLTNDDLLLVSFYSGLSDIYKQEHIELLTHLQQTLTSNLENMIAAQTRIASDEPILYQQELKNQVSATVIDFQDIIGKSTSLLKVLDQLKLVAPTETSVLVTGESGTGKERIVRSLHALSPRKRYPFITINCAALPADLIESILFGHEKGAFTGATERRIGKFEEAEGGTVFLDEIGEMPIDLQSKLLRVLQEKEIERVGGTYPIPVNLRIIAATNRNLEKEIAAGRFRLDLYYRLNIFPIHLPPLRERKEDIPLLAAYFLKLHSKKLGKDIRGISEAVQKDLLLYDWPGNIRELDHFMERSVLLNQGPLIVQRLLELPDTGNELGHTTEVSVKTIAENERDYIIEVLKKCDGKISGEGGAADLLGIPATTLNSKIKKLGITRQVLVWLLFLSGIIYCASYSMFRL